MKKLRDVIGCALFCIVVPQQLAAQKSEEVLISGVVVDPQGAPVADARLGTGWWFDEAELSCYGSQSIWAEGTTLQRNSWEFLRTDTQGHFDARIKTKRGHIALIVFSADGTLAATQVWQAGANLEDISLQLLPVAKLHLDISCPDLGRDRTPATAYLNAVPSGTRLGRFKCDGGLADLLLPPGTYELYVYGRDMQTVKHRVTVKPGQESKEVVELQATFLAKHKGKRVPPWTANAVRGCDELPTFESFRGKWLAVSVWSAFRSSGVSRDIPELIEFDRKWREGHPGEEPPYAVVLLHSEGAANLQEVDAEISKKGFRDEYWGGKPLPFPVLLDSSGQSVKSWQLRYSSNVLLFDPSGLFVDRADAEMLERAVAGEIPTPSPIVVVPAAKRRAPADDIEWDKLPVMERRRMLFETLSRSGVESAEAWCRSLLWNPRQIYVPQATRRRIVALIGEHFTDFSSRQSELALSRHREFRAAIAANKIPLITKKDLTAKERKLYEGLKGVAGGSEANLIANVLRRTRKHVINQRSGDGVYIATQEELPKSSKLSDGVRKDQTAAVSRVLAAFREAGTLTDVESKAIRSELERRLRR